MDDFPDGAGIRLGGWSQRGILGGLRVVHDDLLLPSFGLSSRWFSQLYAA